MSEKLDNLIHEARRALMALYLEVSPSVAEDVSRRVEEVFAEFQRMNDNQYQIIKEFSEEIVKINKKYKDAGPDDLIICNK